MTKWKLETNDDGDEVLIFDESHSLVAWNLEDTDKCCYEILHLIVAAPELLEILEELVWPYILGARMEDKDWNESFRKAIDVIALAKNETLYDPEPTQIDIDWEAL